MLQWHQLNLFQECNPLFMKLSIIIPIFNEADTITELVAKVRQIPIEYEIVLIDDASDDGSGQIIAGMVNAPYTIVIHHPVNQGKGAAIATGMNVATGGVAVIQDADLEYDPQDLVKLIEPIQNGEVQVVYGVRDLGSQKLVMRLGNRFLTWLTGILYGVKLRDMETCYKMWKREVLDGVDLESDAFDVEVELTAKFIRRGERIVQIPIAYQAREAKKLRWWVDGPVALLKLVRYRFR